MNRPQYGMCHHAGISESADLEGDQHTVASDDIDAGNLKKTVIAATQCHVAENGSREITDKGIEEDMKGDGEGQNQLPRDILFFMRDKQSQTQLKQVYHMI